MNKVYICPTRLAQNSVDAKMFAKLLAKSLLYAARIQRMQGLGVGGRVGIVGIVVVPMVLHNTRFVLADYKEPRDTNARQLKLKHIAN